MKEKTCRVEYICQTCYITNVQHLKVFCLFTVKYLIDSRHLKPKRVKFRSSVLYSLKKGAFVVLVEAIVVLVRAFVHLVGAFVVLVRAFVHLVGAFVHLVRAFVVLVEAFVVLVEAFVHLVEAFVHLVGAFVVVR
jgi:hypothetical protein